jgi:hypothetical protein
MDMAGAYQIEVALLKYEGLHSGEKMGHPHGTPSPVLSRYIMLKHLKLVKMTNNP